jgi:hypothetical protein
MTVTQNDSDSLCPPPTIQGDQVGHHPITDQPLARTVNGGPPRTKSRIRNLGRVAPAREREILRRVMR